MNEDVKAMRELEDEYKDHLKEMIEQCSIDGDAVLFHLANDYCVELARCDTADKLLGWIAHLTEKRWMTVPLLRHFIRLVSKRQGIAIHAAP